MNLPSKEFVIKHKFKGDLNTGDIIYLAHRDTGDVLKGEVDYVRSRWNSKEARVKIVRENGRTHTRYINTRQSGYWGAYGTNGFVLREVDLSWKDRIESLL